MYNINEIFIESFMSGFIPVINMLVVPLVIWVVLPGVIFSAIFRNKGFYNLGAFGGLIALMTIGPFSNAIL